MPDHHAPLLTLKNIFLAFHGREVLSDVSLTVNEGEIVTLIGPNGAGKTSLARIALGLIRADRGQRQLRNDVTVGYMPQKLKLDNSLPLTVDRFLWLAQASSRQQRRWALAQVGAGGLLDQQVQQLSGGETQRVLLARALLRKPRLLVLDEPAQGVDVSGQSALYGLLAEVRVQLGCAILLISHDLHWVMASTDRVVCLHHHVCCEGAPDSVRQHQAFTRLFGSLPQLVPYHHHHDHHHDLHGAELPDEGLQKNVLSGVEKPVPLSSSTPSSQPVSGETPRV
jgi:zinc transport system ATP-binding protein